MRTFAIAFLDADAPRTAANFRKLVAGWFLSKNRRSSVFPNYCYREVIPSPEGATALWPALAVPVTHCQPKYGENIFAVPSRRAG